MANTKRSRTRNKPQGGGGTDTKPVLVDTDRKLVQARVPSALYSRIEKAAKEELISMAAYVRRTLQNHVPGG